MRVAADGVDPASKVPVEQVEPVELEAISGRGDDVVDLEALGVSVRRRDAEEHLIAGDLGRLDVRVETGVDERLDPIAEPERA